MYIEVKDAIYMERGKSGGVFFLFFFCFLCFFGGFGGCIRVKSTIYRQVLEPEQVQEPENGSREQELIVLRLDNVAQAIVGACGIVGVDGDVEVACLRVSARGDQD